MELYTIARIAKILKIPESTARYWRDKYEEFIPTVGSGRKRRYKKEALEVLRTIAELSSVAVDTEEIKEQLGQLYSRNMEAKDLTTAITATEQQQPIALALADNLRSIADQKKEIQELREEVKELRDLVKLSWWERIRKKGLK